LGFHFAHQFLDRFRDYSQLVQASLKVADGFAEGCFGIRIGEVAAKGSGGLFHALEERFDNGGLSLHSLADMGDDGAGFLRRPSGVKNSDATQVDRGGFHRANLQIPAGRPLGPQQATVENRRGVHPGRQPMLTPLDLESQGLEGWGIQRLTGGKGAGSQNAGGHRRRAAAAGAHGDLRVNSEASALKGSQSLSGLSQSDLDDVGGIFSSHLLESLRAGIFGVNLPLAANLLCVFEKLAPGSGGGVVELRKNDLYRLPGERFELGPQSQPQGSSDRRPAVDGSMLAHENHLPGGGNGEGTLADQC